MNFKVGRHRGKITIELIKIDYTGALTIKSGSLLSSESVLDVYKGS